MVYLLFPLSCYVSIFSNETWIYASIVIMEFEKEKNYCKIAIVISNKVVTVYIV